MFIHKKDVKDTDEFIVVYHVRLFDILYYQKRERLRITWSSIIPRTWQAHIEDFLEDKYGKVPIGNWLLRLLIYDLETNLWLLINQTPEIRNQVHLIESNDQESP